jgi:hypothetical protein
MKLLESPRQSIGDKQLARRPLFAALSALTREGVSILRCLWERGPHRAFVSKISKLNTKSPLVGAVAVAASECGEDRSKMILWDSFSTRIPSLDPLRLRCRATRPLRRLSQNATSKRQTSGNHGGITSKLESFGIAFGNSTRAPARGVGGINLRGWFGALPHRAHSEILWAFLLGNFCPLTRGPRGAVKSLEDWGAVTARGLTRKKFFRGQRFDFNV